MPITQKATLLAIFILLFINTASASAPTLPTGIIGYMGINTPGWSSVNSKYVQQMINLSESNSVYGKYITYSGSTANFEYFYQNGTIIPAWIESNSSGKLVTWVKIGNTITSFYLGFALNSTNLLSGSGTSGIGEAPQLSPTYAKYDDGSSLFNFYDNFAGTSLNPKWVAGVSGGTYTINNGLSLSVPETDGDYVYLASNSAIASQPIIAEAYMNGNSVSVGGYRLGFGLVPSQTYLLPSGTSQDHVSWQGTESSTTEIVGSVQTGTSYTLPTGVNPVDGNFHIWGLEWLSGEAGFWYNGYSSTTTTTDVPTDTTYLTLSYYADTALSGVAPALRFQWVRTRAYPPNGVMPSITFSTPTVENINVTPKVSLHGQTVTVTGKCLESTDTCAIDYPTLGTAVATGTGTISYVFNGLSLGSHTFYLDDITANIVAQATATVLPLPSKIPNEVENIAAISVTPWGHFPSKYVQQMVNLSESNTTYGNYITYSNSTADFEYFYANGTTIPAWIERNASGNIITWAKILNSTNTIYLGFVPGNINILSNSVTTGIGEAPQLSPTYAEYDDGANVFALYINGNTPISDFNAQGNLLSHVQIQWPTPTSTKTITALNISGANAPGWIYTTSYLNNEPIIAESNSKISPNAATTGADNGQIGILSGPYSSSQNGISVDMGSFASYFLQDYISDGSQSTVNNAGTDSSLWHYASATYYGNTATSWSGYISPELYSTVGGYGGTYNVNPLSSSPHLYLGLLSTAGSAYPWDASFNWARARTYPQNGLMPNIEMSSVENTLPTITISPSEIDSNEQANVVAQCVGTQSTCAIDYPILGNVLVTGTGSATYTFDAFSLSAGTYSSFYANDISTGFNSVGAALTVYPALVGNYLTISNTTVDAANQPETIAYSWKGGKPPYSGNIIVNAGNTAISESSFSGVASTSNTLLFTIPQGTYGYLNISASLLDSLGVSNTLAGQILVGNTPTAQISATPNTIYTGESATISLDVYNGIGPFTANLVYANNGTTENTISGIQKGSTANFIFTPSSIGTFSFNAILYDNGVSPQYQFNAINNGIRINVENKPSGGGGTASPTYYYFTITDNINSTLQSSVPIYTLYTNSGSSTYYQNQLPYTISSLSPSINISVVCALSIGNYNYTYQDDIYGVGVGIPCDTKYQASAPEMEAIFSVSPSVHKNTTTTKNITNTTTKTNSTTPSQSSNSINETIKLQPNAEKLFYIYSGKVSIKLNSKEGGNLSVIIKQTNVTVPNGFSNGSFAFTTYLSGQILNSTAINITEPYSCSATVGSFGPYYYTNGSWNNIPDFGTNPSACTLNFKTKPETLFAVLYKSPASTNASNHSTTSTIQTTTIPQSEIQKPGYYQYIIAASVIILVAAAVVFYLAFRKGRKLKR